MKSAKEIATELASSRSVVLKYLKRFEIPLRSTDVKTKSQTGYGEVWRDRQVKRNLGEVAANAKMRVPITQGLSYWKITAVLNTMGVPTKTGRAKWSAKTAHKILTRIAL